MLIDFLDAEFRANQHYELILFDRLSMGRQAIFSDMKEDPLLYGILQPRGQSDLTIKAVCQETALLFLTLQSPGSLPAYVRTSLGEDCQRIIAGLVLDGVLEIRLGDSFTSGSAASRYIFRSSVSMEPGVGDARRNELEDGKQGKARLSLLSMDALRYGQALQLEEPGKLAARLYFYNRFPASPAQLRQLPGIESVNKYLNLVEGGRCYKALISGWREIPIGGGDSGWRMWVRARSGDRHSSNYKLYVSPLCEHAPEALAATIDVLSRSDMACFKIGADVYGLLRPDKLIAYFTNFESLNEAAEFLYSRLKGCPVHGVPFSAELAGDGLLSWGMDPPRGQRTPGFHEQESWRLWLSNRLAVALISARHSPSDGVEPWRFALDRIALEGVETSTWTPRPSIWSGA